MISFEKFINQDDIDKYNMLLQGQGELNYLQEENKKLREKYKATNKGLIKVLSKRLKWKRRYYKEKYIRKELKKWLAEWIENEEYCYLAINDKDKCRKEVYKEVETKLSDTENLVTTDPLFF